MSVSDAEMIEMLNRRAGIFKLQVQDGKPYYSDDNISVFILKNEFTDRMYGVAIAFKKERYLILYRIWGIDPDFPIYFRIIDRKLKYLRYVPITKHRKNVIDALMMKYPEATACLATILI